MRSVTHTIRSERGFTLAELLAVLVILGSLSAITVLAITRFLGSGTAEAANTEVHQAHLAISSCMVDAGVNQLDTDGPVPWDGSQNVITATSPGGPVSDASAFLHCKHLKATYTVTPSGEITGVAAQEWSGVTWEDGCWKESE